MTIPKRVKEWKYPLSGVEYSLNTQFENSYQHTCKCTCATGSQDFGSLNEAKTTSQIGKGWGKIHVSQYKLCALSLPFSVPL